MKKKSWKKAAAFMVMIAYTMISRAAGWLDNQGFLVMSGLVFGFFMVAQAYADGIEMRMSIGPGGVEIQEQKDTGETK